MVKHDLLELVDNINETTQGDFAAAARRLDEIDALNIALVDFGGQDWIAEGETRKTFDVSI
jgi:hypothetical protein